MEKYFGWVCLVLKMEAKLSTLRYFAFACEEEKIVTKEESKKKDRGKVLRNLKELRI